MANGALHAVFGTGPLGLALMDELLARGISVRLVAFDVHPGDVDRIPADVELVTGDLFDPAYVGELVRDAAVVYQCLDGTEADLSAVLPGVTEALIGAAETHGVKLVVQDDVSVYGPTGGRHVTEATAPEPITQLGRVRAALAQRVLDAAAAGRIAATVGRVPDIFGPGATRGTLLDAALMRNVVAGRPVDLPFDPDLPHTFAFLPDLGPALALLGLSDEADGRVWHLPVPDTRTTRELLRMCYEAAGHTMHVTRTSPFRIRLMALLDPEARSTLDMAHRFADPLILMSDAFEDRFGITGTKLREAADRTVRWFELQNAG